MIHRILKQLKTILLELGLLFYWYPVRKCCQTLPPKVVSIFSGWVTNVVSLMLPGIRKRLEDYIFTVIPDVFPVNEIKNIASRSVANYAARRMEEMYLGSITKEDVQKMVTIVGRENLEASVDQGKGTIILLSHFGSYLIPIPVIGFMGYRLNQLTGPPVLEPQRPIHDRIFKLKKKDYAGLPVTFLQSDIHLKTAVKALKNNELLAIAIDGREGDQWTEVNFLNKKAFFAPGPLRIAQVTGASIVPTFIIRQKDHSYRLVFEKPVLIDKTETQDFSDSLQKLVDTFDNFVRLYPCHAIPNLYIWEQKAKKGIIKRPIFS